MFVSEELMMGESLSGRERELKRKLARRKLKEELYVLCISLAAEEQIDIFPAAVMRGRHFPAEELKVFGLAADRGEALDMVTSLCGRVCEETGGADMKSFLLERGHFKRI